MTALVGALCTSLHMWQGPLPQLDMPDAANTRPVPALLVLVAAVACVLGKHAPACGGPAA